MKFIVKVLDSERVDKLYYLLALLRFLLTLIPQNGYIHPDEYFQSIEVMGGDVFDIETNRPWEFNASFPVRSIFTPFIMIGIPYKILRNIDTNLQFYFNMTIKTPYWLLVIPRIFYCLLSFVTDYCLYKICKINYEKFKSKLVILASSYVILIYGTHTFSNTIEMILMSVLLYLVIDSHEYSYAVVKQDEFLKKKYDECDTGLDRARLYKVKMSLPSHTLRNCIFISFIVTTGIFNRPTFVAFAFPCLFFWIYRGIGYKIITLSEINLRMLLFILNSIVFAFLFVIIDSCYFGYLSSAEILLMDISIKNFVITPINFVKYNMDVNKLAEHGLHPRFLHLFVNIPLLYNVIGIIAIGGSIIFIYKVIFRKYKKLPSIYNIHCLMAASVIIPLATLSYFPHQEPRFLIPITLPLIYLCSDVVLNQKSLLKIWWVANAVCVFFFGFVHQAGLFPLTSYISTQLQNQQQIHLVTSNVYNLPLSLFVQRNSHRIYGSGSSKYLLPKSLILYELGSKSSNTVVRQLIIINHMKSLPNSAFKKNSLVYLVIPLSIKNKIEDFINDASMNIFNVRTFYPHISTEAFPQLSCNLDEFYFLTNIVSEFVKSCGLGLYQVHFNTTVPLLNIDK